MKNRTLILTIFAVVLLVLFQGAAVLAGEHEHDRQGFMIGGGVGGGDFKIVREHEGTKTESDTEEGGAAAFRLGWGFNDQFVLGLECAAWGKEYPNGDLGVGTTLINLTWYPQGGGFFVRGGIGNGVVEAEVDLGIFELDAREDGPAAGLGLGYEWRLTRTFALGGAVDFRALFLEDRLDADWSLEHTNITVQLNWYL